MNTLPSTVVAQPYPLDALERMAERMVKSRLFGVQNIDQAVTLMLVAQSENLHPAVACRDYHIIQGRPTLKADAMMARFQQAGGRVEWQEYSDEKVSGLFSHPQSPKPVLIEWTLAQAKRIGLASKDNWKNYPRQMLRARVISEGVRTTYPAIAIGVYTPEEVQDFSPAQSEKVITPEDERPVSSKSVSQNSWDDLGDEERKEIETLVDCVVAEHGKSGPAASLKLLRDESAGWEDERMKAALPSRFPKDIKAAWNRVAKAEKAPPAPAAAPQAPAAESPVGLISEAQHKRLEARIREIKLDREDVKRYCQDNFGKEHFPNLTQEEYRDVDAYLDARNPA